MEQRRKFKRELECQLTEPEVAERAQMLGGLVHRRDEAELERAAQAQEAKGKIAQMTSEISRIGRECHTGRTRRVVECEEYAVFEENTLREIRLDTGEVIGERPLTFEERQQTLIRDEAAGDAVGEGPEPEPEPAESPAESPEEWQRRETARREAAAGPE